MVWGRDSSRNSQDKITALLNDSRTRSSREKEKKEGLKKRLICKTDFMHEPQKSVSTCFFSYLQ